MTTGPVLHAVLRRLWGLHADSRAAACTWLACSRAFPDPLCGQPLRIRDTISSLRGWQRRYRPLDTDGVAHAREVQRLQERLQRFDGLKHSSLLSQIEELRTEHNLQKLITRCSLVRRDMRQSLREGGEVFSPSPRLAQHATR